MAPSNNQVNVVHELQYFKIFGHNVYFYTTTSWISPLKLHCESQVLKEELDVSPKTAH